MKTLETFLNESNRIINLSEGKLEYNTLDEIIDYAVVLEVSDLEGTQPTTRGITSKTRQWSKDMDKVISLEIKTSQYLVVSIANLIKDGTLKTNALLNKKFNMRDAEKVLNYAAELEVSNPNSGAPYKTGSNSRGMDTIRSSKKAIKYIAFSIAELLNDNEIKLNKLLEPF